MSQRLELGPADVARVRVEASLGPFAETVLAYSQLHGPGTPRRGAIDLRARATRRDRAMASFLWLNRSTAFDLFNVIDRSHDLAGSRELLLNAGEDELAAEAEFWAQMQRRARLRGLPSQTSALESSPLAGLRAAAGTSRVLLFDEIAGFHERLLRGQWSTARRQLAAAQALLEERLLGGGVEGLLDSLGDQVRWTGQALELPRAGVFCDSTHRLNGRGLRVVPSYFAVEPQLYWPHDTGAPVLLLVPMQRRAPLDADRAVTRSDGQLLGRTRTAVLAEVSRGPRTTTELGVALDISISNASQHASILREAGLITSIRDGGRVVHRISALGKELLRHLAR